MILRPFSAIVKREFFAYFYSPLAYVILTAFLLFNGLTFGGILQFLNQPDQPRTNLMAVFFGTGFFWFFMFIVPSVIAMRLIAEERKAGSIEALLTAPVDESVVVAGKFAGAWLFFVFLWLPTLLYPALLARHGSVDPGPIAASYVGVFLIGALFLALGTFASALAKNQIVAAILGFLFIITAFFVGVFNSLITDPKLRDAFAYLNLMEHMDDFSRGIVDTRRIVYVVTAVVFFLFLSSKALEANKGK